MPHLIDIENLDLELSDKVILHDINMSISKGEFISLIGPNGAGKTSLLKVMIGQIKPTRGNIRKASGLQIGYVPQKINLNPTLPMSVKRFMALFTQDKEGIFQSLAQVSAEKLADCDISSLSGGELQRVLIARALMNPLDLLILDEPVQWVDFVGQKQLYQLIFKTSTQRGCSVIMVSHDLNLVFSGSSRVICLNRHICCAGKPDDVAINPSYTQLFGMDQSFATYTHQHDHDHPPGESVS
jgi:zinc transport system ATP-binding protein